MQITDSVTEAILDDAADIDEMPFLSLDSVGMPPPGPDFEAAAMALNGADIHSGKKRPTLADTHLRNLYRRALYEQKFPMTVYVDDHPHHVRFLPGNLWPFTADGPRTASVMAVGQAPGREEMVALRNFYGPASEPLHRAINSLSMGNDELQNWYFTNAVKFMPPVGGKIPKSFVKDCRVLLFQELRLIRPKYLILFGALAVESMYGSNRTLNGMLGTVDRISLPSDGDEPEHVVQVMAVPHPAQVYHKPETYESFYEQFASFVRMTRGGSAVRVEDDIRHEVVTTGSRLRQIVAGIMSDTDPQSRIISVDCEWHGKNPYEPNAWLRTVQFSHKPKHAFVVPLRRQYGIPWFDEGEKGLVDILQPLFGISRMGGHFPRGDHTWLESIGFDLYDNFRVFDPQRYEPEDIDAAAESTRSVGGWASDMMMHAYRETSSLGLEHAASRFTGAPPYWNEVMACVKEEKKKYSNGRIEGYGFIPDCDWWFSYCCYDVDVPRRVFDVFNGVNGLPGLLDKDEFGLSSRVVYWLNMFGSPLRRRMESTGMLVDKERASLLLLQFQEALRRELSKLRSDIKWPKFNPSSSYELRELLYGEQFNGKKPTKKQRIPGVDRQVVRLRPEGAVCLNLTPIKATKRDNSMLWSRVIEKGKTLEVTPAADAETLKIFLEEFPHLETIQSLVNVSSLSTVCNRVLVASPSGSRNHGNDGDDTPVSYEFDDDSGLLSYVDSDGRIRTHFGQAETSRDRSYDPNLQNLSKTKEQDYREILKDLYKYTLRSMMVANPGMVMVEFDLMIAEVCTIAVAGQDKIMMEDIERNFLPKSDPGHQDIHCRTAVSAFHLPCGATQAEFERIGKSELRTPAKALNFGIPYGLSVSSLIRRCRSQGIVLSQEEGDKLMKAYTDRYLGVMRYLLGCEAATDGDGYMVNCLGMIRRASQTSDEKVKAKQKREFRNWGIQSLVAGVILLASGQIERKIRNAPRSAPRVVPLLPMHDALMFMCRPEDVGYLEDEIVVPSMTTNIPIYPRDLKGNLLPVDKPFHFRTETAVFERWNEKLKRDRAIQIGLPERYWPKA